LFGVMMTGAHAALRDQDDRTYPNQL
jgi:hypothetical protein